MKFTTAVLALAVGASASKYPVSANQTYVTEVVTSYTTYCPGPTTVVHGEKTYTVTEATTLTITDCPCTISKPVYTTSVVECQTCKPTYPTTYANGTTAVPTYPVKPTAAPTTSKPAPVETAGAGKAVAVSGAGLAGLLGLVAALL